jgi:hypothetical protein
VRKGPEIARFPETCERKRFFFEKKKQKTFMFSGARCSSERLKDAKVFWFFFSKKNAFLHVNRPDPPNPKMARICVG